MRQNVDADAAHIRLGRQARAPPLELGQSFWANVRCRKSRHCHRHLLHGQFGRSASNRIVYEDVWDSLFGWRVCVCAVFGAAARCPLHSLTLWCSSFTSVKIKTCERGASAANETGGIARLAPAGAEVKPNCTECLFPAIALGGGYGCSVRERLVNKTNWAMILYCVIFFVLVCLDVMINTPI